VKNPDNPRKIKYLRRMLNFTLQPTPPQSHTHRVSTFFISSSLIFALGLHLCCFRGRGPELEKTKESLEDLHAVRFRGEVPNAEISALLRAQDVFVLLSDYEGLPLSLLEAMGEGVVPVISDLKSGTGDVVTERNGLKVKVGDVAAAADAIISLAGSPARLAEISASASELARGEYSSARMAERYLSLIGSLAKTEALWPADVEVYPPLMLPHPWLYRGLARRARRLWRRIRPA
jgi:hypothetical protein